MKVEIFNRGNNTEGGNERSVVYKKAYFHQNCFDEGVNRFLNIFNDKEASEEQKKYMAVLTLVDILLTYSQEKDLDSRKRSFFANPENPAPDLSQIYIKISNYRKEPPVTLHGL